MAKTGARRWEHVRSARTRDLRMNLGRSPSQTIQGTSPTMYNNHIKSSTVLCERLALVVCLSQSLYPFSLGQLSSRLCHYLLGRCNLLLKPTNHSSSRICVRPCGTAAVSLCISHHPIAHACRTRARTVAVCLLCLPTSRRLDFPELPILSLPKLHL
jgi:hypothetical protein